MLKHVYGKTIAAPFASLRGHCEMSAKLLICLAFLLVLSLSSGEKAQKPHIILVLADDMGYNDIGYHNDQIESPHLDLLARSGVILENYYVQPICTPTRSQLMSGRYQIHTGLQHRIIETTQPNALPDDSPTIADKMRESGYSTHMVGKWHLGFYKEKFCPWNRGFDSFYGFLTGQGDHFRHVNSGRLDLRSGPNVDSSQKGVYSTHLFTDKAINVIRETAQSDKPLFLFLSYQAVHGPTQCPKIYYKERYSRIKEKKRKIFSGMVTALDEGVRNVTDTLKELGMWENTLFVFSSDNGAKVEEGGSNYPLRGGKRTLWEGGIRSVGFVAGGRLQRSGVVSRELTHVSDWYPTFVRLAGGGLNGTKPLDGVDQWEAINEGQPSPREVLLHNLDPQWKKVGATAANSGYSTSFDITQRAAIRKGDWKLLTGDPGRSDHFPDPTAYLHKDKDNTASEDADEFIIGKRAGKKRRRRNVNLRLYNIAIDPEERNEVSADNPQVVQELLRLLEEFESTSVPVVYPPLDEKAKPAEGEPWGPWP